MKTKYFSIIFALISFGCSQKKSNEAQIRIGQFLFTTDEISVILEDKEGHKITENLNYFDLNKYKSVPSGRYTITVKKGDDILLKKKYGLAKNGKYTAYIFGIPLAGAETNRKNLTTTLHHIVEGEDTQTENGGLPQLKMLDDSFQGGEGEAQIRWLNLAPLSEDISGEANALNSDKKISITSLSYGKSGKTQSVKAGEYSFKWQHSGGPLMVAETTQTLNADSLYTFFILPKRGEYVNNLEVVSGASH
ncbi:MAG: hypothetical protein V7767_15145 [Leeuwenhoekiella sp.]